ncbi:hypothetical protein KCP69_05830 [Salmonella enterica subsp. enterica]|nr:hypothetical protein KCP69_05830 [Salmonella enterica subsp. enterica]
MRRTRSQHDYIALSGYFTRFICCLTLRSLTPLMRTKRAAFIALVDEFTRAPR